MQALKCFWLIFDADPPHSSFLLSVTKENKQILARAAIVSYG